MLSEFNDAKIILSGHAFIAPAIEQGNQVHSGRVRFGVRGGVRQRHLDASLHLALHEDVMQNTVLVDVFGIKHGVAAAEAAELSRVQLAELRLFYRGLTQKLHLGVGARHLNERQPP